MIRVTLTNSKLDKELGRKKKTSTEDFLFSRKRNLLHFYRKNISLLHFVNAHKNHSGFIPPVILFYFYPERNSQLSHSPLARVQIRTPFCARM